MRTGQNLLFLVDPVDKSILTRRIASDALRCAFRGLQRRANYPSRPNNLMRIGAILCTGEPHAPKWSSLGFASHSSTQTGQHKHTKETSAISYLQGVFTASSLRQISCVRGHSVEGSSWTSFLTKCRHPSCAFVLATTTTTANKMSHAPMSSMRRHNPFEHIIASICSRFAPLLLTYRRISHVCLASSIYKD